MVSKIVFQRVFKILHSFQIVISMADFETLWNTFFWKPLKPVGDIENSLKHIFLKTTETYGRFWKHFGT